MNNEMTEAVNYLSILDNIISLLNENNIPSSTALFFRIYFLDPDKHATIESKLKSLSPKNKIWESIENDNMYNKNISMHYYLMFSIFGKEVKDRVVNIIKAIQRPVLCVEDRLLNYEANKLALEMFQDCLDENTEWTSSHNIVCKELNDLKKTNRVLIKTIIPKLTTEHYAERHKQNPIKELYISLSTPDMMINEKILHVIVTAAIDYIDTNSNKYKKIKENIKLAIKFLKHYAEGQEQKLNDEEKTYILDEENIPEQDVINYDTKEHMDVVYNTYYSNKDIRIKNIFIAFKWLAELNGVLSNNSETDILQYQIELKSSIDKATKFVKGYDCIFYNEDHLNYLRVKRKAKILAPISRWEASNWAGGWISSKRNKITLKMLNCTTLNDKQIEIYVNMMYPAEYDTMYSYIKDAIDEVVISSEDRVRNMEAHELFSKYLMQRNRNAIEKVNHLICIMFKNLFNNLSKLCFV
ncbi:uncharacterized protein LOC100572375 [Acyrthosiphon pisum]|uniref:Uncharacterized protein n=1 Tax=Acyrthosiphon pisum TaxID=7029 RepID=A0A8R2NNB7_ACYPI|nr:uncharacterized protein LOC100572375 [Acyrthosiphon pisum]